MIESNQPRPKRNAIELFLKSFLANQISQRTAQEYQRDITQFGSFLIQTAPNAAHNLKFLTKHHLIAFRQELERGGYAPNTTNRKLASVSSYLSFLASEGLIDRDIVYGVKRLRYTNRRETYAFSEEQVSEILNALPRTTPSERLRFTLLCVGFYTGLRSTALRHIKVGDIIEAFGHTIIKVIEKGSKTHEVILHPVAKAAVDTYIAAYNEAGFTFEKTSYLFQAPPSRNKGQNKPINATTLNYYVEECAKKIGLQTKGAFRMSAHAMRATFATNLLRNDTPLDLVQHGLGHASPATTAKYNKQQYTAERSAFLRVNYKDPKKP